ncbi:MAG: DNA-directed RNA polymerase subunit beta', partial [candidate division WOR-3 bacterium]
MCEALRGKQGRFRRHLLGKRVDYSGRSVIVVDPALKLHQCSLPKEMALELFKPLILQRLEERRLADSDRGAKTMYRREAPEVWEVLEEVTREHPVLLNRAPTLHRVSMEAFFPILSENRAIGIHPLVCPPFNADFDGDTMSVHVPLTPEAILESSVLMLASHNLLSPAHGRPLMVPTQDIVAGVYYITKERDRESGKRSEEKGLRAFDSFATVRTAYELGELKIHEPIRFQYQGEMLLTTTGRVLFNDVLPEELRFVNDVCPKDRLVALIERCARLLGMDATAELLDRLKELGFEMATVSGLSLGIDDFVVPEEKGEVVARSEREIRKVQRAFERGLMTDSEKYNKVVNTWTLATAEVEEALMARLSRDRGGFNPLFVLIDSGARGSRTQAAQIAGMRGLMAKPQRRAMGEEVIETPIKSSFREGLSVWEYFISTHGARKGLTDTALKTAEAGYLTRRLVDVAQDVVITMEDCGTIVGQEVTALREGGDVVEPLSERISGRFALDDITNPVTGEVIVHAGEEITDEAAEEIEEVGIEMVRVRSVLTCEAPNGLCVKCYGRNMATGDVVEIGEAVGIVAAQSIGEPGTQLTLKTFHVGGAAARVAEQTKATARSAGRVRFEGLQTAKNSEGLVVALEQGRMALVGADRVVPFVVPTGAVVDVADGQEVQPGDVLFEWEPYSISLIAKERGRVVFEDIEVGVTLREDIDERTERMQRIIMEDRDRKLHPRIVIVAESPESRTRRVLETHALPSGAYLVTENGKEVLPGDTLARLVREMARTKDITGGLPKVAELFEAKRVKDPAVISEIDGTVEVGEPKEGVRLVQVVSDGGAAKEYEIPYGKFLLVRTGDRVRAGDKLCEGSVDPHDVLRVKGWLAVQEFLTNQIQAVYRLQKVKINDKHISVIVRQMLRKVRIEEAGDSGWTEGEIVERRRVLVENERLLAEGLRPASYQPILLGITRAALLTESFLSAASFQETTRVLSEAAIQGREDKLRGLKENVIVGRLIPAGTGFREFSRIRLV